MSILEFAYYIICFISIAYMLKSISELREAIKILRDNQTVIKEAINSLMDSMKAQHSINKEYAVIFDRIFHNEQK